VPTIADEVFATRSGKSAELAERHLRSLFRASPRIPLAIASAHGCELTDLEGRRFWDLTSGWNVANVGWQHPHVVASARRQLDSLPFAPSWCTAEVKVALAERMRRRLGGNLRAVCGCGGSEAIEAALKIARRVTRRQGAVGFLEAYHGGTLGAVLAGGLRMLHGEEVPGTEAHRHAPVPDALRGGPGDCERAVELIRREPHPAAVLLEPIFTNPGVLAAPPGFYSEIARAAREVGALLIVDEIGTGFARTGKWFAYEHFGLDPDVVVVGKAFGGGVAAISGAFARAEYAEAIRAPSFDATFGWTPLACAAALAVLDVIENEELVERAAALGAKAIEFLRRNLAGLQLVGAVRGWGLEIGVELVDESGQPLEAGRARALYAAILRRGVFAEFSRYTTTLLIMPPLTIEWAVLEECLSVIAAEIRHMHHSKSDP
jgi:4-aminobutyrate aminotransferase-like enzyme